MSFKDLVAFSEDPVTLSIRGREFTFPGSISARIGLLLQRVRLIAVRASKGELPPDTEAISDAEQEALTAALLGEAAGELLDYATKREYDAVLHVLFNVHVYGREFAEQVWNDLGEASAPDPRPARGKARGFRGGSTSRPSRKAGAPRGATSSDSGVS